MNFNQNIKNVKKTLVHIGDHGRDGVHVTKSVDVVIKLPVVDANTGIKIFPAAVVQT